MYTNTDVCTYIYLHLVKHIYHNDIVFTDTEESYYFNIKKINKYIFIAKKKLKTDDQILNRSRK